jgi:hypothetical protein
MSTRLLYKRYTKYRKKHFSQIISIYSTLSYEDYFENIATENPSVAWSASPFEILVPANRNAASVLRISFVFNSFSCYTVMLQQCAEFETWYIFIENNTHTHTYRYIYIYKYIYIYIYIYILRRTHYVVDKCKENTNNTYTY